MNKVPYKKRFWISIGLWIITVSTFAWFFVNGTTQQVFEDTRTAVMLSPAQRSLVLGEMRSLLESVNGVLIGLSENDFTQIEQSARAAGMNMDQDVNPALIARLPLAFKQMGMGLHKEFDALADSVRNTPDASLVLQRLTDITRTCVTCHSMFALTTESSQADSPN